LSSRVRDCLTTPLALASFWKSKGAARRIVKDKGSGLIKPIETHRKRTDRCKELEDSDVAKERSPGQSRDKAEDSSLGRSFRARESSQQLPYFLRRPAHIWPIGLRQTLQSSLPLCFSTVSCWFCPSRPYCGMSSARSWHTVLVREHVSRSNGMRCFTS
jgi:hypothetical protein